VIGAVVGVQPFGGHGLSGTGPKAGGPLYVRRLLAKAPPLALEGLARDLPGPVGERNSYRLRPKGTILCVADDPAELQAQVEIARATGNRVTRDVDDPHIGAALFAGSREALAALARRLAARDGPIVPLHLAPWRREALLDEVSLSVNTAAAGGNASLMTIG
jgi:RHH-type proline utilization regulon transcriptional repressor/proline dehydrogenase/delta 1-pyrroline-5-carboxylate dehydrogenase